MRSISGDRMQFFTALTCATTLPDDHEWDEAGEATVKVGGESAAIALAELLRQTGTEVGTLEPWEDYGWCFDAQRGGRAYQLVMSRVDDEVFIHVKDMSGCAISPWRNRTDHPIFMDLIYTLVAQDPRFGSPEWSRDKVHARMA